MKRILMIALTLISISGFTQIDDRIKQIRELYIDYNERFSDWDTYEITWNTAGSYPSATIYTDYNGKILIKTSDADEFSSGSTEYYFFNDTIQFIFSEAENLLTHWAEDTVRFELLELRYYFEKGEVIRTLKKHLNGIEGQDDKSDFNQLPNITIDHLEDYSANWGYYEEKIEYLIDFCNSLERVFY